MKTQTIHSPDLISAATRALGGPPLAPPAMPAAGLPQRPGTIKTPATGNPTFDPTPPAVLRRRNAVEHARSALTELVGQIRTASDDIRVELAILAEDSSEALSAEAFDPKAAATFLDGLATLIAGLSAPAATAPEKKPRKPTESETPAETPEKKES